MIKFIFSLIFLIPLANNFWLTQFICFLFSFLFILIYKFDFWNNLSLIFGLDYFSFFIILLSYWICRLIILSREKIFKLKNYCTLFLLIIILLLFRLLITFSSINLFIFYLFFEIRLLPTLILIIGWGYQPERIQAGMYLLFYTLFFSLPIMVGIFLFYKNSSRLTYFYLINNNNFYVYLCINLVFLVKIPIYFIHLWLPKAHVEASVSGSIILAGVILKLGGYGLIRLLQLFSSLWFSLNLIFIVIRLTGGFLISLICICQNDLKSLIAYSSVVHIGVVLSGILTLNFWGIIGGYILMLAHGLCSSGLFCLANITYERLNRRRFYLNKGLITIIPRLSFWWFLFSICNIAAPPSLNLLGEIFLINSLLIYRLYRIIFLILISFFRAVYSLFIYSYVHHGNLYSGIYSFYPINLREFHILMAHWIPLNFLILKSELFIVYPDSL